MLNRARMNMQLRQDIVTLANWQLRRTKIAFANEQNKLKKVNQSAKRLLKKCALLRIDTGAEKCLERLQKGNY
jgi:DNA uptake protein ComE-like DNA-binding protein